MGFVKIRKGEMENLIVIDFETYYDKQYGLKKYTTEEYIRDPQFEVIGVALKHNQNETVWKTGTHKEIKDFLYNYNFSGSFVVGHNMRFDGAILSLDI
jgi:DNA polymerase bacteriophage-type